MVDTAETRVVFSDRLSAAASELEQAATDFVSVLTGRERELAEQVLHPARKLAADVARAADLALEPFAEFIERERDLADQMAAWAELQHQLADHMAAWAVAQRRLAAAFEVWLTPASGAARATTQALHRVAGDLPEQDGRRS